MFSVAGMSPTTFNLGLNSAKARNMPSTEAAPHMSNFISSIPAPPLSEIPPVSNVTPLPISTVGAAVFVPPMYFSTIKRSGSFEPRATDINEPMPSLATSLGPKTSQATTGCALASDLAASPNIVGVAKLAGRFANSLAKSCPATNACPCKNKDLIWAALALAKSATPTVTCVSTRPDLSLVPVPLVAVYT